MRICCDECETRFRAPNNVTAIRCPKCGTELDLSPRSKAPKSGSYLWVVFLVLGLTIPMMLAAGFCMVNVSGPRPTNARCPQCTQEFNIPVHHGVGQLTSEYSCPNCGVRLPAAMLYKR